MKSWARDVSLRKNFDEGNRRLRNYYRFSAAFSRAVNAADLVGF
jgi:hypothetical protein